MDADIKRSIALKLLDAHSMLVDAVGGEFVSGSGELEAALCIEEALEELRVKTKPRERRVVEKKSRQKDAARDPLVARASQQCLCTAPMPVHLLFALSRHHCSCGCVWKPNADRSAFEEVSQ